MNHYFYKIEKGLEDFLSCKQTLYASPLITINDKGYTKHYFEEGKRICSKIGSGGLIEVGNIIEGISQGIEEIRDIQREGVERTFDMCMQLHPYIKTNNLHKTVVKPYEGQINPGEPIFYYHSDHLGSASFLTDTNGIETQQLVYLPFGEDWIDMKYNTSQYDTPYKFNGKEKDEELRSNREYNNINNKYHEQTGYNNYGARYYYDWASIWLSVDPMSDKYPHVTSYNYCANNPVMLVDPDGRSPNPPRSRIEYRGKGEFGINIGNLNKATRMRFNEANKNSRWNTGEIGLSTTVATLTIQKSSTPEAVGVEPGHTTVKTVSERIAKSTGQPDKRDSRTLSTVGGGSKSRGASAAMLIVDAAILTYDIWNILSVDGDMNAIAKQKGLLEKSYDVVKSRLNDIDSKYQNENDIGAIINFVFQGENKTGNPDISRIGTDILKKEKRYDQTTKKVKPFIQE